MCRLPDDDVANFGLELARFVIKAHRQTKLSQVFRAFLSKYQPTPHSMKH